MSIRLRIVSPHARQFFERVEKACQGTPYVVTETAKGFDLEVDVSAEAWRTQLQAAHLSEVFTHHVAMPTRRSYSIVQEARSIVWTGDTPHTAITGRRRVDQRAEPTSRHVWAGAYGTGAQRDVSAFRFTSDEGRDLITHIAEELGLTQRAARIEGLGQSVVIGLIVTLSVICLVIGIGVIVNLVNGALH